MRKFTLITALFALSLNLAVASEPMIQAKQQSEELLTVTVEFAKQMLTNHGEFIPYGGAIRPDGEIISIGGTNGDEHPESQEIIDLLKSSFISAASKGEYIATALVFDVKVIPPGQETKTDAIAVAIDHKQGLSVIVLHPYQIVDGKVSYGEVFAYAGEGSIFEN